MSANIRPAGTRRDDLGSDTPSGNSSRRRPPQPACSRPSIRSYSDRSEPARRRRPRPPGARVCRDSAGRLHEPLERLTTPDDLCQWIKLAALGTDPRCNAAFHTEARVLREAIYRVIDAERTSRQPHPGDLGLINHWAAQPTAAPQLDVHLNRTWISPVRARLARLARSATELLSGIDVARISNCANPSCSLLFLDQSRP